MNNVTLSQAQKINDQLANGVSLDTLEFMTDAHMAFDQQDRILNAISQLRRPTTEKISKIIEQAGISPDHEWLTK